MSNSPSIGAARPIQLELELELRQKFASSDLRPRDHWPGVYICFCMPSTGNAARATLSESFGENLK